MTSPFPSAPTPPWEIPPAAGEGPFNPDRHYHRSAVAKHAPVNGVLSLLIGLLTLIDFPSSADWAIGLLVGIDLLSAGWGLLTVSGLGKRLAAV